MLRSLWLRDGGKEGRRGEGGVRKERRGRGKEGRAGQGGRDGQGFVM
jgi:hypothetical protein